MIKLIYGHLADYAAEGAMRKMIVVGIFDHIFVRNPAEPVALPISYLAGRLEASMMDGAGDHTLEIDFVDGNHHSVHPTHPQLTIQFGATGPGYPLVAQFIMMVGGLGIPGGAGDYEFTIKVDGESVGAIPLVVAPAPT